MLFRSMPEYKAKSKPFIRGKIIEYLEHGKVCLTSPGVGIDEITGKQVMQIREIRSDGEYGWSSMLPYYVKKYNMRLPSAFVSKVLHNS